MSEAQRSEASDSTDGLAVFVAVPPAPTIVVSYGAGTNSTAMLIGMHERGERPDLILFADTGGERPETYRHRDSVSDWCEGVGFPRIVTVAEAVSLEADCLTRGALPGIAYGFKSCSDHYKIRPQKRWLKAQGITAPWFWVGIDAGEAHRMQIHQPAADLPRMESILQAVSLSAGLALHRLSGECRCMTPSHQKPTAY